MERIRNLDRYPKILLLSLLAMAVIFAGVYGFVTSRKGYLYGDTILVPTREGGTTLYSGKIDGQESTFTVTADTVIFLRGETAYGPYILREDPAAIPEGDPLAAYMTGILITDDGQPFFRGGMMEDGHALHLFQQDGSPLYDIIVTMSDGTETYVDGKLVDPFEPSPYTVVSLLRGPELTHKGEWSAFLTCLLLSAILAVSILFADELFRFRMSFRVQDVNALEPSDWELASRHIGWGLLTGLILILYFVGLG